MTSNRPFLTVVASTTAVAMIQVEAGASTWLTLP
jgi:hypothetical protein